MFCCLIETETRRQGVSIIKSSDPRVSQLCQWQVTFGTRAQPYQVSISMARFSNSDAVWIELGLLPKSSVDHFFSLSLSRPNQKNASHTRWIWCIKWYHGNCNTLKPIIVAHAYFFCPEIGSRERGRYTSLRLELSQQNKNL